MILYGAGGHARVILEMLEACGIEIESIYDDNPEVKSILGHPVYSAYDFKNDQDSEFVISIGCNSIRSRVAAKLNGLKFGKVVDPSAQISPSSTIRKGTVVMPGVIINAASVVGDHAIINTGAVVEHDCNISDFVHLGPNSTLCGEVSVGEGTLIGAGSVVIPGVKIGSWVTVGAGSVVLHDVPDHCTTVGNPARTINS